MGSNTVFDYIMISVLLMITVGQTIIILLSFSQIRKLRIYYILASNLISEETKRKAAHTKAFEDLINPDKIMDEMERTADILEARQANRLTMPRPDAGPPAKVYRPKLRGKPPGSWNSPHT